MPKLPDKPQGIRLNKVIADSGYCARRKADALIAAGQVQVNGKTVQEMGLRINPETDRVTIAGKPLPKAEKRYALFHKPTGYVTSRKAGKGQKTIYELLPKEWQSSDPAGRLDQDSSGLLILSSDGDFLHQITHPRFHLPKIYEVQLVKPLSNSDIKRLKSGILLQPEEKLACMPQVEAIKKADTYRMTLITGYNRQIRRSVEALGNQVVSLKRIEFGSLLLDDLPVGQIRSLTALEQQALVLLTSGTEPKQG
jgi:23S rRNA pseudouridine2605 synthase